VPRIVDWLVYSSGGAGSGVNFTPVPPGSPAQSICVPASGAVPGPYFDWLRIRLGPLFPEASSKMVAPWASDSG
jgi:hypothetical protein